MLAATLTNIPTPEIWSIAISSIIIFVTFTIIKRIRREDETGVPYITAAPSQCLPNWRGESIEPQSKASSENRPIPCHCPANGKLLGYVQAYGPGDIDDAIRKATDEQPRWAMTTFAQRRRVLNTLLRYVLDNQEVIARIACLDSGKTMVDASFGEILVTAEKLRWTILHGEKALRRERRPTNFLMAYKVNEIRWEPLGVVAACTSWNYPFHNVMGPIISSLFAGNAIVIKGSESTAWSTQYFIEIGRSALRVCGHSPELIQSVICWPDVASHLTSHIGIKHLTFIGSRAVGLKVAQSAAESLTPVCMELGGKDAALVLDDVDDLDVVCSILMRGTFQSAGQNCIGIERIVACQGVYDDLVGMLHRRIQRLRVGDALDDDRGEEEGIDVGAMISDDRFGQLEELIREAIQAGARCLVGGRRYHHPKYPQGSSSYFSPTLLVDVLSHMRIARTEVFAPICVVMRATDVDDAIRIANSTDYDLGASVFGHDPASLDKVVGGLRAGMVSVNDFAAYYAVQLPFGGVHGSDDQDTVVSVAKKVYEVSVTSKPSVEIVGPIFSARGFL